MADPCEPTYYGSTTSFTSNQRYDLHRYAQVVAMGMLIATGFVMGTVAGSSNLYSTIRVPSPFANGLATPVSSNVQAVPRAASGPAMPNTVGWVHGPRGYARPPSLKATVERDLDASFSVMDYIGEKAKAVNSAMSVYVPETLGPHPKIIFDAMRHSLLAGGKRIRPALVIAAAEMVGGTQEVAMPTACAVEMIHTMSLIHDDLPAMDNDDFRRGKPTCHKAFGEDIAILAGDALLAQSFALVAKETKGVPADRILKVITSLGTLSGAEGLVGGQVMDMQSEGKGGDVQLDTLEYIHTHKTGALLEAAVVNGACVGGATDEELEVLRRFAQKIGLAFQIIDDVLDSTKSAEQLGKTAGKDEAVAKATYVKLMGLTKSQELAEQLIVEAKSDLAPYGDRAIPLLALADFITQREH
uniref:Geranylgeranyl diphosphate synthase n=1 Tax=Eutreptiella gymnastica TaxID=73025 RepID=A0A7S4GID6_9EUGL